jgi:hypothetical protein
MGLRRRSGMRRYRKVLRINEEQRAELQRWASSRTLPAGDVFRARLILALASGKSYSQIEGELGTSRPTIARWRKRFQESGLAGLDPQHKGSPRPTATPKCRLGSSDARFGNLRTAARVGVVGRWRRRWA